VPIYARRGGAGSNSDGCETAFLPGQGAFPVQPLSIGLRLPAVVTGRYGPFPVLRWRSELTRLALTASPIVLIGLINMAMSIADIVMLGRYDAEALRAVVVVSDLYSVVFNFSAGFAGVVTPQVAAAIGARVRWQVCDIVRRTLLLVLALGLLGALAIVCAPGLLGAAGLSRSESAAMYAVFMAGSYVFMLLFTLARAVLSSVARPGLALLAVMAALPVKVAANYAFIYGAWGAPELGAAGAGLASFLVAALMGGSLTAYLFVSPSFREFDDPRSASVDLRQLCELARAGVLMGVTAVSETGVFLGSTIVVGLLAPQDVLAHALAFRAMAVCYLPVAGLGQAVTIRMAFLHARAADRPQAHAVRAIALSCIGLIVLVLGLLWLGADWLGGVLAMAVEAQGDLAGRVTDLLGAAGPTLAALIPAHVIAALLRARNDVAIPTGLTVVSYWGVALGIMLLLAHAGHGAYGAWLSLLIGASVCSAGLGVYLWRLRSA
jgi:MATE family multidrug resistance protein